MGERPEPYHPGAPGDSPKGAYNYAPGHPALGPHVSGPHGFDQNNGGSRNWNRDRAPGIQKGGKKGDETNRNSIDQSSVLMVSYKNDLIITSYYFQGLWFELGKTKL